MNLPEENDYIDIHTHGAYPLSGVFSVVTLMAHEKKEPQDVAGLSYTYGIHPWYLTKDNHNEQIMNVIRMSANPLIAAIGEAGFDKIKGPPPDLQRKVFEEQVYIAEEKEKPLIIHCVKAWDELTGVYKRMKPKMAWLIHGFHGKKDLALQLISKGFYLSLWSGFSIRPESTQLIQNLPVEKIFLETDGTGTDIKDIYTKVAGDLGMNTGELKKQLLNNFFVFFGINKDVNGV